jgi:hypothetical protein
MNQTTRPFFRVALRNAGLLLIFAFMGLGVFYNSSKFHVPWYGGQYFAKYSQMVEAPFSADAGSPFAYRIVTPLIAHLVEKSGVFYRSKGPFGDGFLEYEGRTYSARILSALIFTNYLLLVGGAFLLSLIIGATLRDRDRRMAVTAQVLAPGALFLALSTNVHALAGLTEGGSIFFICLLLYLLHRRNFVLFAVIAVLSIAQRELIPMLFFVYILASARIDDRWRYLAACAGAALLFFAVKFVAFPIAGNEHQTDISAFLANYSLSAFSGEFIKQAILANNILFAAILLAMLVGTPASALRRLAPFAAAFLFLAVLGIGAGIGNNVGRILNLALPMLLIGMVDAFAAMRGASADVD